MRASRSRKARSAASQVGWRKNSKSERAEGSTSHLGIPAGVLDAPDGFLTFQLAENAHGNASPAMATLKSVVMPMLGAVREGDRPKGRWLLAHGDECVGRHNDGTACECLPGRALRAAVRAAAKTGKASAGTAAARKVLDGATEESAVESA